MAQGNNIADLISDIASDAGRLRDYFIIADNVNNKNWNIGVTDESQLKEVVDKVIQGINYVGQVSASVVEGNSYTIPRGFHDGTGTVKGLTDTSGEAEKYKLQSKEILPAKEEITVGPDEGFYGLESVKVLPIPAKYQDVTGVTATADKVLNDSFFVTNTGVRTQGTMVDRKAVTGTLDVSKTSFVIEQGYHNGEGAVSIVLETKTATPTEEAQHIAPTAGKVLSQVTINPIPENYGNASNVTVAENQLLSGVTAIGKDAEGKAYTVTGTMPNNENWGVEVKPSNSNPEIAEGYYNGEGEITVATQNYTFEPTAAGITVNASTNDAYFESVTIKPIPDTWTQASDATITSAQVLEDEIGYGLADGKPVKIVGTMPNNGNISSTLTTSTTSYTVPKGYHNGGGSVNIILEEKSTVPSEEAQTITPSAGKVLSKVTVAKIPDAYGNTSDATITANEVLDGEIAYTNVDGVATRIEGTMANNGAVNATINPASASYTVPEGYHNGSGTVSLSLEQKTATPTEASQTITASTGKTLSQVIVNPIPLNYGKVDNVTVTAGSLLSGTTAIGKDEAGNAITVTGTIEDKTAQTGSAHQLTVSQTFIKAGEKGNYYAPLSTIASISTEEIIGIIPTKQQIVVEPEATKVLSKVTINPIPDAYQDVTGVTATADKVYEGLVFVNTAGQEVTGTMEDCGTVDDAIYGGLTHNFVTNPKYELPTGYYVGGEQVILKGIYDELKAI